MKAFIVAALLVASVAGQSLDMYKSMNKDQITSRKGLMGNRFSNFPAYQYGGDYSNMINGDYEYPSTRYNNYFGGDEETYMNVLSYEEITTHPLFRDYMTLPLFRQYWSYPMFQRYVCSHYFQRYWTMPAFQQYFEQPSMFYKYIYPIVQLFKYESSSMNTYTGVDSFWNRNSYPMGAEYYQQQQYVNGGLPSVCRNNFMYCRALFQKMYNHLMYTSKMIAPETTSTMDINDVYKYNPYFARMMYPTMYNDKQVYPTYYNEKETYPTYYNDKEMYPTVYNKEFHNFQVPSKMAFNNDVIRPFLANTINKAMIGDKTFGERVVPEQMIKA